MTSKNNQQSTRLIQISDVHLGRLAGEKLLGIDTDESFQDVLNQLSASESNCDFVVASGDISSEGARPAYSRFLATMRKSFNKPLAWLAGNHDSDLDMQSFPKTEVLREWVELEHWQLVLLNSSVPGHEHGDLQDGELIRLRRCLDHCDKPALVFVHHQPLPIGSTWIDQYVIRNAELLLTTLAQYPQVKALCWGHVHQDFNSQHAHFGLHSVPSTCIQFKPQSEEFALDITMPGYRWFDLHADGTYATAVARTPQKNYGIDFASSGY